MMPSTTDVPYPPKIAIVTHGFLPCLGGAETHLALIARGLQERAEPRVMTAALCLTPERQARLGCHTDRVTVAEDEIQTDYLPAIRLFQEKFILPLPLLFELLRFNPDLIWTSHPSASVLIAGFYARLRGKRWVATYHADVAADRLVRRLFMRLESWWLRSADLVEVSSSKYFEVLSRRSIEPSRILVVQPFTYEDRLGKRDLITASDHDVVGRTIPPFLFVGTLDKGHAYKHPDDLLVALGRLKAENLRADTVLVGDGDRRRELEQLARTEGAGDVVRFAGKVTDGELSNLYRQALALVVPSSDNSEGFGLVILESLSHGCPVLSADSVPGIQRFINGGGALTFQAGNVRDLTDKLRSLLQDRTLRDRLSYETLSLDLRMENRKNILRLLDSVLAIVTSSPGRPGSLPIVGG